MLPGLNALDPAIVMFYPLVYLVVLIGRDIPKECLYRYAGFKLSDLTSH
jgi:hypothetical protein